MRLVPGKNDCVPNTVLFQVHFLFQLSGHLALPPFSKISMCELVNAKDASVCEKAIYEKDGVRFRKHSSITTDQGISNVC